MSGAKAPSTPIGWSRARRRGSTGSTARRSALLAHTRNVAQTSGHQHAACAEPASAGRVYHEAAVDVRYWSLISRCKHCYMGQRLDRALKMPFEKVARTLEMWRLMGGWKLTILGGEPTLHPDYIRIIRLASSSATSTSSLPAMGSSNPHLANCRAEDR